MSRPDPRIEGQLFQSREGTIPLGEVKSGQEESQKWESLFGQMNHHTRGASVDDERVPDFLGSSTAGVDMAADHESRLL